MVAEFFKTDILKYPKFFAYLHFMDPHIPYGAPTEFNQKFVDRKYAGKIDKNFFIFPLDKIRDGSIKLTQEDKAHIVALYDAELSYADSQIGRMFDRLEKMNLLDNTMIIIHSDHGEEFWEHGGFEHGHTMYNELLHVPLIIVPPKMYNFKGQRIKGVVRLIDVFPTVIACLNLHMPAVAMGMDLSESLTDGKHLPGMSAFSEAILYGNEIKSIQTENNKLIKNLDPETYEFYRLKDDPGEQKNIENHNQFNRFKMLLENRNQLESGIRVNSSQQDFNSEDLRQLKSLGYIQ